MKNNFSFLLPEQITNSNSDLSFYGQDSLSKFTASPSLILFPKTTKEVQKIIQIANKENIKLVPSGGRTGYSGGATATNKEVIVSLSKMNQIIDFDPDNLSIKTQAGVITDKIQEIVNKEDLFLPIDLASSGSSQIGGNIATNAGGGKVIRYGKIGNWVQGLTAVTASGEIINLDSSVKKEQLGFDLKKLLIGSEGTLAIITEVTMKLSTQITNFQTLLLAGELEDLTKAFTKIYKNYPSLSSAEYFTSFCLKKVCNHLDIKNPFSNNYNDYLLIEIEDQNLNFDLSNILESLAEESLVKDAIIASNENQRKSLWAYRENISETLKHEAPHKQDISIPISKVNAFITQLKNLTTGKLPGVELYCFGHLGDGNLHLNYLNYSDSKEIDELVFSLILEFNGSLSAEHGIGLLKKEALKQQLSEEEIQLMKQIKQVFDPNNILNPGKIFD